MITDYVIEEKLIKGRIEILKGSGSFNLNDYSSIEVQELDYKPQAVDLFDNPEINEDECVKEHIKNR
jgi:hypothetical protein